MVSTLLWLSGLIMGMGVLMIWLMRREDPRPWHSQTTQSRPDGGDYSVPMGHSHSADSGCGDGGCGGD